MHPPTNIINRNNAANTQHKEMLSRDSTINKNSSEYIIVEYNSVPLSILLIILFHFVLIL